MFFGLLMYKPSSSKKYFESWKNIIVKISSKYELKIIHHKFLIIGWLSSPISPVFVGVQGGPCPSQGPTAPGSGWKTIDWKSSQLVLVYYWLTFLYQVWFLNFRHVFCSDFDTDFIGVVLHDFLPYYDLLSIVKEKKNSVWNFSKYICFSNLEAHNFFLEKFKYIFFSDTYFFMILNIFWNFYPF